jgi:hypothetical protein
MPRLMRSWLPTSMPGLRDVALAEAARASVEEEQWGSIIEAPQNEPPAGQSISVRALRMSSPIARRFWTLQPNSVRAPAVLISLWCMRGHRAKARQQELARAGPLTRTPSRP